MAKLLSEFERGQSLPALLDAGWTIVQGRDAMSVALKFKNFSQAWAAMSRIALAAEAMDHHPEWANVYNRLTITLTTHSCNGLSELDLKLAKTITMVAAETGGKLAI